MSSVRFITHKHILKKYLTIKKIIKSKHIVHK